MIISISTLVFCLLSVLLTKRYCHEFWLLLITALMQIHACMARYFLIYFIFYFFLSMAICLVHMAVQYIIPPHPGLMVTSCLPVPCCSEAVFSADFPQASSRLDAKLLWPPPWLLLGPRHAYTNTHQKPTHMHTLTLSHLMHTAVRHTLSATCQKQGIHDTTGLQLYFEQHFQGMHTVGTNTVGYSYKLPYWKCIRVTISITLSK